MSKENNLFNGRLTLKRSSADDKKFYEIVKRYMTVNNIATFTGATKKLLIELNESSKTKENINVHYWIPVSKEDVPKNLISGETTS